MALTKTLTLTNNFGTESVLKDVYIKISRIEGDKSAMTAEISLLPNGGGEPYQVKRVSFTPQLNENNFIKQAYLHIKTLPEFSDATDC
jgi:PKD repeat protein